MIKTTIYLPEALKAWLRVMADASGQSEAGIIREAIAAKARNYERPRTRGGLFASADSDLSASVDEALVGFGQR